jgi:hypothetical protein
MMCQTEINFVEVRSQSKVAIEAAVICAPIKMRRFSNRSATAPLKGASKATGKVFNELTIPSNASEPVNS